MPLQTHSFILYTSPMEHYSLLLQTLADLAHGILEFNRNIEKLIVGLFLAS